MSGIHEQFAPSPAALLPPFPLLRHHLSMQSRDREVAETYLGRLLAPHKLEILGRDHTVNFVHCAAKVAGLTLHFLDYGVHGDGTAIFIPQLSDGLLIEFPLSGTAEISRGPGSVTLGPGAFVVTQSGYSYASTMSPDYRQLALQIPGHLLTQTLAERYCDLALHPIQFRFGRIDAVGPGRLLANLMSTLCDQLDSGDPYLMGDRFQSECEQLILSLVLDLPNNFQNLRRRSRGDASPLYVRRAEDFIHANLTDEITLDDIVSAAGASKRSLHAGFRRFRQTTPLGMLRRVRLEAARIELEKAKRTGRSVTDIATEFGFFHLSKFAQDFKAHFGILPSHMLRGFDA